MFDITVSAKHNRTYRVTKEEREQFRHFEKDEVIRITKKILETHKWLKVVDDDERIVILPVSEVLYVRVDEVA